MAGSDDEKDGAGLGIVDVFLANGQFLSRVATRGPLDAPVGPRVEPGRTSASSATTSSSATSATANSSPTTGTAATGPSRARSGTRTEAIVLHGLWGIGFGGGTANNGATNTLFYAAGPNSQRQQGIGTVTVQP